MDKVDVKFGSWIEEGFNLYKKNFGILVLSSLIAVVISAVSFGILAGPMLAGVLLITMTLFDEKEPKPEVGNVFKGFSYFLQSFLFVFLWGIALCVVSFILALVPCIGQLVSLAIVFFAQAFLMFGLFLIVDQQMEFWPASMESINKVKTNLWPFIGFSVVSSLIGSIGGIACGIGVALTLPIQACILTVAYREVFNGVKTSTIADKPSDTDASTSS